MTKTDLQDEIIELKSTIGKLNQENQRLKDFITVNEKIETELRDSIDKLKYILKSAVYTITDI